MARNNITENKFVIIQALFFKLKYQVVQISKVDFGFIVSVFEESLDLDDYTLNLDSEFGEVPDWDSLGHMKIIAEIESRLDLEFEIDEIVGVDTVSKLVDMVNIKLSG